MIAIYPLAVKLLFGVDWGMELSLLLERLRPVGLSPAAAVALSDEILPFLAADPRLPITPEQTEALAALLQSPKTLLIALFPIPAETRDRKSVV